MNDETPAPFALTGEIKYDAEAFHFFKWATMSREYRKPTLRERVTYAVLWPAFQWLGRVAFSVGERADQIQRRIDRMDSARVVHPLDEPKTWTYTADMDSDEFTIEFGRTE